MPYTPMRRGARDFFDWLVGGDWLGRFLEEPLGLAGLTYPAVDVEERPTEFRVTADLPGYRREDVEVTLRDNLLELRGRRAEVTREEHDGLLRQERRTGRFARRIPLPGDVNPQGVRATFQDGVLEITLPKARPEQTGRRIPIE